MAEEGTRDCLVEEREVELVCLTGYRKPIKRKGWFIKSSSNFAGESLQAPSIASLHKPSSHKFTPWIPKALFKGWASPQHKWGQWVDKLRPIYEDVWKKAGIFHAIKASTYKIRKDTVSVCRVLEFWCGHTNTFLFPWSEATVTLEDVMILGGFSVLGECAREVGLITGEFAEIEIKLIIEHKGFYGSVAKKPCHSAWLKHFIQREGDQLEHIAFLSLWLSRYVFPSSPEEIVKQKLFSIAIRLARGTRIGLAPAVLASLYRDLRVLREHVTGDGNNEVLPFLVRAPFQILQLWVWERFMALRPEASPHFVQYDEPRAARWHNICMKKETSCLRLVPEKSNGFQWRPYTIRLDNWRQPSFYKDNGEWVCGNVARDEELVSFARCLRASELVGLDCIEKYIPDRVAMQFGLDQDRPCFIPQADTNCDWELAWATYDKPEKNVKFYIAPRLLESDVTLRYHIWWKKHMLTRIDAANKLPKKRTTEKKEVLSTPKSKKHKLEDDFDTTLSVWNESTKAKHVKSRKPSLIANLKLFATCAEQDGQGVDYVGQNEKVKRGKLGEASASHPLAIHTEGIAKYVERVNTGESTYNPILLDSEGPLPPQEAQFEREAVEERTSLIERELEFDVEIKRLKEEIAELERKIIHLESMVEVQS